MMSDSGIDSNWSDPFENLSTAGYEYSWDGDRRRHGLDNIYPLPNDDKEIIRLDNLHYMFYTHHGMRNVLVPIQKPRHILDLGTGSGRWVCEVAAQFPMANVIGQDLVPANPLYEVPTNAEFTVADFNDGLIKLYPEESFDLIHSRYGPWDLSVDNVKGNYGGLEERPMAIFDDRMLSSSCPWWLHPVYGVQRFSILFRWK